MAQLYGPPSDGSVIPHELEDAIAADLTDNSRPIGSAVARKVGKFGVSDFVNSWWCAPRSVYSDLRRTVYQGGVNSQGEVELARIDLRRKSTTKIRLGLYEVDDHNVPAFLVEDDQLPVVAIVRHAVENFVRVRIGTAPHDVESLENAPEQQVAFPDRCTYAHLHRRPGTNTLALLTRVGGSGWYVRVSRDWGQTWEPAVRFHGRSYSTFNVRNGVAHYLVTDHPITSVNTGTFYFRVSLETGVISDAAGTIIGDFWNPSAVLPTSALTQVQQSFDATAGHNTIRAFDLLPDGSVLAMKLRKEDPELGGEYGVFRRAETADWAWEPIVASGVPVGYYQSSYVGGMSTGANSSEVYLCREASGTWTTERWTRSGGSWTLAETLQEYTDGTKLGRPQVPWGAYGSGLYVGLEYHRYLETAFHGYYGDQVVLETGVKSTPPPTDSTPPPAPTNLQATAGADFADLTWTAAAGAIAYDIFQGTTRLATVTGTSHRRSGLNAGQAYVFRIRAVDEAGNKSAYVDFPSVTPSAQPTRDPILTDSGSLVLLDPSSAFGAWASGVPSGTVPNLAADSAAGPLGAAFPTLSVANTLTAQDGTVERTAKGGLHMSVAQSGGTVNRYFGLTSEALRAYMAANVGHSFYVSAWVRVTRQHGPAVPTPPERYVGFVTSGFSDTQNVRLVTGNKLSVAPSANRIGNKESATPVPVGEPQLISGAHSAINAPGSDPLFVRAGTGTTSSTVNEASSWILYRVYLEDLTVTGRTYADVAAIDQSLHTAAFGAGGRYAGDTYTAPA